MAENKISKMTWTELADKLGCNVKHLKRNCRPIMMRLDALSVNTNYRTLWPKQIKIILDHLGYSKEDFLNHNSDNNA